jgi:Protein of unknown function (DUF2630)
MTDRSVFSRINELAEEEERLWDRASGGDGLDGPEQHRLEQIKVELDQCYDLLHQRRARRAAGLDPDEAEVRREDVVERYQQ